MGEDQLQGLCPREDPTRKEAPSFRRSPEPERKAEYDRFLLTKPPKPQWGGVESYIDIIIARQTDRLTYKHTDRQTERKNTYRQADSQSWSVRQTLTDKQTDIHIHFMSESE